MSIIVDSQNVVSSLENAPDRLRAEIGSYYTGVFTAGGPYKNFNSAIKYVDRPALLGGSFEIVEPNNQTLIPTKRMRILFSGREEKFRDQDQWNDYIRNTVSVGTSFLDHQFDLENFPNVAGQVFKNFHHPTYEDNTKTYPSNQLLNYNLISYPHKDMVENVSRVGDVRTRFDDENYLVGPSYPLIRLMEEYANRVSNYTGSVEELSVKQRHIFDLETGGRNLTSPDKFPFYFRKYIEVRRPPDDNFIKILSRYRKNKQIMQSIKQDLSFANRSFRIGAQDVSAKIYNFINLMTSTRIVNFSEQTDETFLLPEGEISNSDPSDRFLNSVNAVRFLGEMRNFISTKSRGYRQIINSENSETFFLGYKIEKYLDNDATQPIQTYYMNPRKFFYDTQMKYGRKYIYKTKVLIGILGSSYTYSNLFISQNEIQMMDANGNLATDFPSSIGNIASEKYRAYVDVEVTPSFQILEYQIDEDEITFVDDSPNAPQVYFFNQPHKPHVEFFFSPMYEDRDDVDDRVRMEYFNGIYEIYRLERPPTSMQDFEDGFLTSVDDQTTLTSLSPSFSEIPDYSRENMNGYYADRITQNQKYYYAFKAVTYHGTKSGFTVPFEVEMVKDSDEYKVTVSEYQMPMEKDYVFERKMKRIMKITPNIDRLLFTGDENTKDWRLDDGNMLTKNQTTKFKIRVTSKHTGKKMDINLNFFLDDRT